MDKGKGKAINKGKGKAVEPREPNVFRLHIGRAFKGSTLKDLRLHHFEPLDLSRSLTPHPRNLKLLRLE
jgi:hypothetical protein